MLLTFEDVRSITSDINASHGLELQLRKRLTGGAQGGAWLVVDATREWVLKPGVRVSDLGDRMRLVEAARLRGWPTPRWLCCGSIPRGRGSLGYYVQELVFGTAPSAPSMAAIQQILGVLDRGTRLFPGHLHATPYREELVARLGKDVHHLLEAGAGFIPFAESAQRAASVAFARVDDNWPDHDFVHHDFSLSNFLFANGVLVAVVDCAECEIGSGAVDMAELLRQSICYDWDERTQKHLVRYDEEHFDPGPTLLATAYVLTKNLAWCLLHRPNAVATRAVSFRDYLRRSTARLAP